MLLKKLNIPLKHRQIDLRQEIFHFSDSDTYIVKAEYKVSF